MDAGTNATATTEVPEYKRALGVREGLGWALGVALIAFLAGVLTFVVFAMLLIAGLS